MAALPGTACPQIPREDGTRAATCHTLMVARSPRRSPSASPARYRHPCISNGVRSYAWERSQLDHPHLQPLRRAAVSKSSSTEALVRPGSAIHRSAVSLRARSCSSTACGINSTPGSSCQITSTPLSRRSLTCRCPKSCRRGSPTRPPARTQCSDDKVPSGRQTTSIDSFATNATSSRPYAMLSTTLLSPDYVLLPRIGFSPALGDVYLLEPDPRRGTMGGQDGRAPRRPNARRYALLPHGAQAGSRRWWASASASMRSQE
jgi:hypothetical protein